MLLIGWDAADWDIIHPLMDEGQMPNLERLVNNGVMGNLATLYPDLSPMLWTSIATGKRPFKHGIYGFIEPDPDTGAVRPITNLSRRTKALWNILSQTGRKCNVIGWWPSHPVEPINGVMVSNHYPRVHGPIDKPWPIRPGTVHPARITRNLAELRWHPQNLNAGHILPYVPRLSEVDQDKDRRLEMIAKTICECSSIQDAALAIMYHEPWDFTGVYFDSIDHFCHGFMRFHPPRLDWVSEAEFDIYNQVVRSGYIYHDMILGKLLKQAGDETAVIIVSDHGFESGPLRPRHIPLEPAGPAAQHRHYGILVMHGPGIKKDEIVFGASQLDVCPTILTLMGLPVAKDMDGKPLVSAFEKRPLIDVIESWEDVPGDAGTHPPDMRLDPMESREAIRQLVALGYIEEPGANKQEAVKNCVRELDYNLARAYMDADRHADATVLLEKLLAEWPEEHRFGIQLVTCYQALGRYSDGRRTLEAVMARKREVMETSREELKRFQEEHKDAKPEDLTDEDRQKMRRLRARVSINPYSVEYLMGSLLLGEGDEEKALTHLKQAERIDAKRPELHVKLGDTYLKMKRWEEAERCFIRALELDPENALAHRGLGRSYLAMKQNRAAAEEALAAVGLIYHNPQAHYLLGIALHRMGKIARAVQALKMAISQNPNFPEAHRRLAYIYKWRLKSLDKWEEHRALAREAAGRLRALKKGKAPEGATEPAGKTDAAVPARAGDPAPPPLPDTPAMETEPAETVVVVSGLPRSGTSMMMQMLRAGGLPLLTDEKRSADDDNPRGYFEYEPAKKLQSDRKWLSRARGRAVKIVAQLLRFLPPGNAYRVIVTERDMDELVRSQKVMLGRQGKQGADLSEDRLKETFAKQMNAVMKMLKARGLPALIVRHRDCIRRPEEVAAVVNRFLGGRLDEAAMAWVVDVSLYRQKGKDGEV